MNREETQELTGEEVDTNIWDCNATASFDESKLSKHLVEWGSNMETGS